jgi:hypothetical protein
LEIAVRFILFEIAWLALIMITFYALGVTSGGFLILVAALAGVVMYFFARFLFRLTGIGG